MRKKPLYLIDFKLSGKIVRAQLGQQYVLIICLIAIICTFKEQPGYGRSTDAHDIQEHLRVSKYTIYQDHHPNGGLFL